MQTQHKHLIAGLLSGFWLGVVGVFTLAWLHKPTQDHIKKHVKLARNESARLLEEQARKLKN